MKTLEVGDEVRVVDGPFATYEGAVIAIDHALEKVTVLVSVFGRRTPVRLDFAAVEKQASLPRPREPSGD